MPIVKSIDMALNDGAPGGVMEVPGVHAGSPIEPPSDHPTLASLRAELAEATGAEFIARIVGRMVQIGETAAAHQWAEEWLKPMWKADEQELAELAKRLGMLSWQGVWRVQWCELLAAAARRATQPTRLKLIKLLDSHI